MKPMPRRQEKKAAKKAAKKRERANPDWKRTNAVAVLHNSRARRFHHILARPGRGGLTATGAAQLQKFFSKKVPDSEKPSLNEMDNSARMIMLQMTAEEVGAENLTYEELKQVTEKNLMASGAKHGNARDGEDGKAAEDMGTEAVLEAEDVMGPEYGEDVGDEDGKQGGVCLANDL